MISQEGSMHYRKGTISDLKDIVSLVEDAIREMERKGIHQWDGVYPTEADFERDILNDTLFVAEHAGELMAVYVISQEADEAYDRCTWKMQKETACVVHRLCVSPRFQNKGFGGQILENIEEQAAALGYRSIRLDVFTQNPYALKIYRRSHYEERGFADWRKGRFILMEKGL